MADQKLLCASCEIVPETIRMKDDTLCLRCPGCGIERSRDEAIEAASLYISRGQLKGLQDRLVRSAGGSKTVKYRPGRIPSMPEPDFIFK